jgi:D-beta-D-heptose 7-phosphate kinase/D-beta-D-heptose 1-phosphate adenosyltransferase
MQTTRYLAMVRFHQHQTIEKIEFPPEWSEAERTDWLAVWKTVRAAKADYKQIVLVTGVFDLFHSEHAEFLRRARQTGNFLIVGVESDERVREMKGPTRPIQPQEERLQAVLNTGVVDMAAILPEAFDDTRYHRALLAILKPHWLAVSSHSPFQAMKQQLMAEIGGQLVVVYEQNPAISTTKLSQERTIKA